MLKDIFEVIIFIIIFSFIWRIIKRFLFTTVTKNFQDRNPNSTQNSQSTQQNSDTKIGKKVHWDAETVDYEEIKDPKDSSN